MINEQKNSFGEWAKEKLQDWAKEKFGERVYRATGGDFNPETTRLGLNNAAVERTIRKLAKDADEGKGLFAAGVEEDESED